MKDQNRSKEKALKKELRALQKEKKKQKRVLRAFLCGVACTALALVVLGTVCACAATAYIENHPEVFKVDPSLFRVGENGGVSQLYYFPKADDPNVENPIYAPENAVLLESESPVGTEKTRYVRISEIPEVLQNAFVAIEDKRFYTHRGVDLRRTGAAILNYVFARDSSFGGSTITQQLIKNVTGENAKTPMRKISEIFRALDLEKELGKSEILEAYLNIIHLANGCRGVGAASELYFGKEPSELTLSECASIAAITQNPSKYDPIRHPENNRVRRDNVLRELYLQGYITEGDYESARKAEVRTVSGNASENDANEEKHNSWYTDLVIEDVIDGLTEKYGYTRAQASHMIYYGGLHIYTLMDPELQRTLTAYYSDESNFPRLENGKAPQSGMIVLDPETGNILAVAGAIGAKTGDRVYSFATDAKRPPGSVLKPLSVYAPALEYGIINYATVYDDVPVTVKKHSNGNVSTWPRNASGIYRGLSSVDYAISHSLNTVAVRVLQDVGIDRSFDFLKNTLGIDSLADRENGVTDRGIAALALGQMNYGATLREITAAYTIFTNGGVYRNARSYALVTDASGQILLDNKAVIRPAISEENAELMTKMLENVTKSGTARTLTVTESVAAAGKTGTTQYSFDRWFVGYTPSLLAGVWYGCEYPETLSGIGGNPALSIWDNVIKAFYLADNDTVDREAMSFSYDRLRAVRVCADSGLLVSDACTADPRGNRSTVAYFAEGTVPKAFCTCHTAVLYSGTGADAADGVVLSPDSSEGVRWVGLIRADRDFPAEIYVSDAQYTAAPIGIRIRESKDPLRAYYAESLKSGTYVGKSYGTRQFNRPCTRKKSDANAS